MDQTKAKSAALVTGAAKRLGRAMALSLAERGYDIAVHYSGSQSDAEQTAEACKEFGVRAETFKADLLDVDDTAGLVPKVSRALGPLSILINNASIFEYDTLESATQTSWERHIDSNLRAPLFLTQAFAEQVPEANRDENNEPLSHGLVINMVDQRVRKLTPEFMTYTVAKMGLWAFTQTAAQALAPRIRVNAIGPGPTMQGARQTAEHFAAQRSATVLKRGSSPKGIVQAMNYFINADDVTGQLLCVDGGQHLAWQTPDIQGVE
jgi:NAD(P)-dependent dehydrogenase (short-subunit alcohol dehydrogenase family)